MKRTLAAMSALILAFSPFAKAQEEPIPIPEITVYIDASIKLFYIVWWSAGEEWNYDVDVMVEEFNKPSWFRPMATLNSPRGHWMLAYTYYDAEPRGFARISVSRAPKKTKPAENADEFGNIRRAKDADITRLKWITIVRY